MTDTPAARMRRSRARKKPLVAALSDEDFAAYRAPANARMRRLRARRNVTSPQ